MSLNFESMRIDIGWKMDFSASLRSIAYRCNRLRHCYWLHEPLWFTATGALSDALSSRRFSLSLPISLLFIDTVSNRQNNLKIESWLRSERHTNLTRVRKLKLALRNCVFVSVFLYSCLFSLKCKMQLRKYSRLSAKNEGHTCGKML